MGIALGLVGLLVAIALSAMLLSPWVGGIVLLAGLLAVGVTFGLGAGRAAAADEPGGITSDPPHLPGPGDPDSGVD